MILPKVRDLRFITVRRGGTLQDDAHQRLAVWAADCAEHVLHHFEVERPDDDRPGRAIALARAWARSEVTWQVARTASFGANAAARDLRGAARYAAYAAAAEREGEVARWREREWQRAQLPAEIRDLLLDDERLRNELCWFVFEP